MDRLNRPSVFDPAAFHSDEALVSHIRLLSQDTSYRAHKELTAIAAYIQAQIVEPGLTADHLTLVSAILATGLPSLSHTAIARDLERTTRRLARTKARTRMELAPAYSTLWAITLNGSYLTRFEQTVRHCYLTVTKGKTYPNLGIDPADPQSLAAALRFLSDNRQTLYVLNPRYSLAPLLRQYPPSAI